MILTILQARVSSTRLPGKVLMPILGRPLLALEIERLKRIQGSDRLVVATSREKEDTAIETLCAELHVDCFRGDLKDVLDRFYQAARPYKPDSVIRVTGDCPLIDPEVVDAIINDFQTRQMDYVSNTMEPTFPDGLDAEVFRFSCLEQAWKQAQLPSEREHVTPFIFKNTARFKTASFKNTQDLSGLRWTVDYPEDFELVRKIYEALYPSKPQFGLRDILALFAAQPELAKMNTTHPRNEGYTNSLREDEKSLRRSQGNR